MADLPDEALPVIIDALADAAEYHRWQAESCACQAIERGADPCESCGPHEQAAEQYEAFADWLADEDACAPPPRPEQVLHVRGELL